MDSIWIVRQVTVMCGELVAYWVLIITLGVVASMGWALYVGEKRKQRLFICPMVKKPYSTTIRTHKKGKEG